MNKYTRLIVLAFVAVAIAALTTIAAREVTKNISVVQTPERVYAKFSVESTFSEYKAFSPDIKQKIRTSNGLWHYVYTIKVPVDADAFLISQFMDGGLISINNIRISQLPTSTLEHKYLWYRPHLVQIPANLRAPRQETLVQIQSSSYLKYLYMMPVYAGSFHDVQRLSDIFTFISRTLSMASSLIALVAGFLLLLTWRVNKQDKMFFYAGASAIAWSGLFFWLNTPVIPSEAVKFSRLFMYIFIGASLYSLMQYLMVLAHVDAKPKYKQYLLIVACCGPVLYMLSLGSAQGLLDKYWIGLIFVSCLPAIIAFLRHLKAGAKGFGQIVGVILIAALTTAYKDFHLIGYQQDVPLTRMMLTSDFFDAPLFTSYLVMPVVFLFSAGKLLERYRESLLVIKRHNLELEAALKNHEVKLNLAYLESLQKKEREIAELTRSAIHRDLHDGIGSRLVATTFALRAGNLTRDKLEESLINCLKDIRAIMQLETQQEVRSIQDLLFEYLSEMEHILSGTSVVVTYDIPEDRDFTLLGNRSIEVLRMIQEILSNALKHSNAKSIHLDMELSDSLLTIKISEGRFENLNDYLPGEREAISTKTGLKSLEIRARNIGAVFLQKDKGSSRISLIALKLFVDRFLYLPDHLPPNKDERRIFLTSQISELTNR